MRSGRFIIGVIIILFGLNFLFNLDLMRILIAGLIIWVGFRMLTGEGRRNFGDWGQQTNSQDDEIDRVLVFSGMNKKFVSNSFKGATITAIFGGAEVDLSDVKTTDKELTLEFTAVFGGIRVKLPKTWSVSSDGVGILGGFENSTRQEGKTSTKVRVKGAAIFGGVELTS